MQKRFEPSRASSWIGSFRNSASMEPLITLKGKLLPSKEAVDTQENGNSVFSSNKNSITHLYTMDDFPDGWVEGGFPSEAWLSIGRPNKKKPLLHFTSYTKNLCLSWSFNYWQLIIGIARRTIFTLQYPVMVSVSLLVRTVKTWISTRVQYFFRLVHVPADAHGSNCTVIILLYHCHSLPISALQLFRKNHPIFFSLANLKNPTFQFNFLMTHLYLGW